MNVEEQRGSVAAVDCGTNSTRLIVVDGQGSVLHREMRITRLGERTDGTRKLNPTAIDRTLTVLRDYRRTIDRYKVVRTRVVATSAARDARNAESFMAAAADITGVRPEVLTGEEEGRLSFLGASAHLPVGLAGPGPLLVADIGGGSTELTVGHPLGAGRPAARDVATRSLDMGCVRVTERFFEHDPPSAEEVMRARHAITEEVMAAHDDLPDLEPHGFLVGVAGTVSTLARLDRGIVEYRRDEIHHAVLTRESVERWLHVLSGEDGLARLDHPGMEKGREDVIVGGVLVLAVVMACFERDRCLVSEDDILDGMAATLLAPA